MINTLSTHEAVQMLMNDKNADWDYEDAKTLVEWYEQLEEDMGESIEIDIVAIRCEWSYYSEEEMVDNWGQYLDKDDYIDDEEYTKAVVEYVKYRTTVLDSTGGYLVMDF